MLSRHLDWCRQRNLRDTYVTARRRAIQNYEKWLGHSAETATERELQDWYGHVSESLTAAARAVALSHICGYYRWLVHDRIRIDDPTVRLVRPRLQRRLPRPISDTDLEMALRFAPNRVAVWLKLAAYMGLRACEIARVRSDDVRTDLVPPVLIVSEGKGGKSRILPLHPEVAAVLPLDRHGWLFPHSNDTRGPVRPHNVSHGCNQYLHSIGITHTLHTLRHWFGTSVYRESQDLRLTQELMGHATPATTAGYAAWDAGKSSTVVNQLRV